MKRVLSFSILPLLFFSMSTAANAQSCTNAVCNANSASESDVLAALPSSGNTNATVVVNIPSGNVSWSSDLKYTIPSGITNLTIQGATTINWTGTPGTSSWAYSVNDQTIIGDADPSNNALIDIVTGSSNSKFRLSGLTLHQVSGGIKYTGDVHIEGGSHNVRIDHIHVAENSGANQDEWFRFTGGTLGVVDHSAFELGDNTRTGNVIQAYNPYDDNIGWGDGSWAKGTQFGTVNALYIESNYFLGGAPDDCVDGARFVMRYNTLDSNYVSIQTHGLKTPGGSQRACNSYEAYHNYITGSSASRGDGSVGAKGGTALIWGNTMAEGYYRFYAASTDRNGGDSAAETNTPNGWGYCGTTVTNPSSGSPNGVGSPWDGNTPSITQGYPCLDGLGRGQDTQALNGQGLPNRKNSVTGTIAWPHQYLQPIYMWNNKLYSGATHINIRDLVTTNNRDYYYDCGSQNSSCSGSFTGAAGTGFGLKSARPSTCTAGPGGTYFQSPTGSYGVAYFATDDNNGNGELYVCTATNTWTAVYQPLVYPHPIVSGTTTSSSTPPAPTGLVSTVY